LVVPTPNDPLAAVQVALTAEHASVAEAVMVACPLPATHSTTTGAGHVTLGGSVSTTLTDELHDP
jgi:hypothetical protein